MIFEVAKTHSRIATIIISFDAGSRVESKSDHNLGISHMLEHSLFKGTANMSAMEIQKRIAFLGGSSNAFTSHESVAYYVSVPYENLEPCVEILSDMVFNPVFPEDEILREIEVVKEEELSRKENVSSFIWESFSKEFFGDHYLGTPVIGFQETIDKFSREELVRFHEKYCQRSNAIISLCCNLTKKDSKSLLKKYFGRANGKLKKLHKFSAPTYRASNSVELTRENVEQTHVWMGMPSVKNSDERSPAIKLMMTILGSGMDSRLFEEVREKRGLVYGISSSSTSWQTGGFSLVQFSTRDSNVREAKDVVFVELEKIKNHLVSDEELQRAKNKLRASFYAAVEDSYNIAYWQIKRRLLGIPSIDDYMSSIETTTPDDIRSVSNAVFDTSKLLEVTCRKK
jgi:predicted Zn-dependent peptidase